MLSHCHVHEIVKIVNIFIGRVLAGGYESDFRGAFSIKQRHENFIANLDAIIAVDLKSYRSAWNVQMYLKFCEIYLSERGFFNMNTNLATKDF